MSPIWKVSGIWTMACYTFGVFAAVAAQSNALGMFAMETLSKWQLHAIMLCGSLILAVSGVLVLWALPIRHPLIGSLIGAMLAAGTIVVLAFLGMWFFGGFERNIGIIMAALALGTPSILAGGYAGFVRGKITVKSQADWWPTSS